MILSAFENELRAGLVQHTMQTNTTIEHNKNIKCMGESVESVR